MKSGQGFSVENYRLFVSPDLDEQALRKVVREIQRTSRVLTSHDEAEGAHHLFNSPNVDAEEQLGITLRADYLDISRGQNTSERDFKEVLRIATTTLLAEYGLERIQAYDYSCVVNVTVRDNHFEKLSDLFYSAATIGMLYRNLERREEKLLVLDNDIFISGALGKIAFSVSVTGFTTAAEIIKQQYEDKDIRIWIGFLQDSDTMANSIDLPADMLEFGYWCRGVIDRDLREPIIEPVMALGHRGTSFHEENPARNS